MSDPIDQRGQALVEFAFFSLLVLSACVLAGSLLREEWRRSKCAYLVFEATHRKLVGSHFPVRFGTNVVEFTEDKRSVQGSGRCGGNTEKVVLPKLEFAHW